jgi:hypothetical protein
MVLMNLVLIIQPRLIILYDGGKSFYEELAHHQKAEMDRRKKERKDKTKVEFVSGAAKRPGSGSGAEDGAKRQNNGSR